MATGPLSYPSTQDISHGLWLKQFVAALPALADRYDLRTAEIRRSQRLARQYLAWLRHYPRAGTRLTGLTYLQQVQGLVRHMRRHPAYRLADGRQLGLPRSPWAGKRHGQPVPRLFARLCPGSRVVVRWRAPSRAHQVEVQACRDGLAWHTQQAAGQQSRQFNDWLPAQTDAAAQWLYRARFHLPGEPPGPWGPILLVNLPPVSPQVRPARPRLSQVACCGG